MSAKGLLRYRSESSGEGGPPRPPSMGSDGGTSLASSPESRTAVLEEERDDSFDEGIDDILAENPSCNLCGHNFYSTADFLNHVRMHFSGGAKEADSRKRRADEGWEAEKATKAKTPRTSPSSQQDRSPGGGDQMVNFSAQEEPKEQVRRGSSRTPSPPTALPARSPTFPPAAPAPNQPPAELLELLSSHQHMVHQQQQAQLQAAAGPYGPLAPPYNPFLPHMPYPNYQPPPYPFMAQPVAPPSKCPWCPAIFEKQEAMLYHMQLHQLQQPQQQAYQPQHPPQEQVKKFILSFCLFECSFQVIQLSFCLNLKPSLKFRLDLSL